MVARSRNDVRCGAVAVTVHVVAAGADTAGVGREALVTAAASAAGVEPVTVRTGRSCPTCGASDHGRPWAEAAGTAVPVSLARTTGIVAVAALQGTARSTRTTLPTVGVDVERVSRVAAAPLDASGRRESARFRTVQDRTAAWAVTEAVLKRDGRGLRVDPARVEVDLRRGRARLDGLWQPVTVTWLDADLVLAVAAGGLPVTVAAPQDVPLSAGGA